MKRLLIAVGAALALLILSSGCGTNGEPHKSSLLPDSPIDWRSWIEAAFAEARSADKLVFLYLDPFWCEPCVRMKEKTFTDPRIVELLSDNFITIYSNSERDPSLYERYQLGTFPSCLILTPDAGMLGGSNALPPDSLLVLLNRILDIKKSRPEVLSEQSNRLEQDYRETVARIVPGRPSEDIINNTERAILSLYDSTFYGFGDQPKYPLPEALRFMLAAVTPEDLAFESQLTNTLNAQLSLYDTVWGGFGRSARTADWLDISYEKLLDLNTDLALLYFDASWIMNDSSYAEIAAGTLDYIWNFLRPQARWGYYNSQRGFLRDTTGMEPISPAAYFALSGEERLQYGTPAIDTLVYAGTTAKAVSAFLRVGRALKQTEWQDYALATLDSLIATSIARNGAVRHQLIPAADLPAGLLPDQTAVAAALIDAYETTGERNYLTAAELVASFIINSLEDRQLGGLRYEAGIKNAVGREQVQIKPYIPNSEAVWLFTRLYYLTANSNYQRPAESTLRYVVSLPVNREDIRLPYLASAYMNLTRFPTLIVMEGERNDSYQGLLDELWQNYYPREVVVHLGPADGQQTHGLLTFPKSVRPLMFACGYDTLSTSIFEPENVHPQISRFLRRYQISR